MSDHDNPSFFFSLPHFSRVHQYTCTVLQHILHVLSHWAGYVAVVLLAALFQSKEADRVERPRAPYLAVSKHHPNILPLWTSFSKTTASGTAGAQILVFTAVRESTKVVKKKTQLFTCLFSGGNMKSTVGRNAL